MVWKLIRYPLVNVTQLFDLQSDPHETKDLSGEASQADRIKELMSLLAEQQKALGDTSPLVVDNPQPAKVDLDFFKKKPAPAGQKKAKKQG